MAADARRAAVEALLKINHSGGYSNIVLDNLLKSGVLTPQDQIFATRLLYGVTERRLTIDYALEQCSSVALKKMHPTVLEILRLGVYQLLYMDRIPASAAVNEAVKLTRQMQQGKASGFVNGVLRSVERKKDRLFENLPIGDAGDAVRYSCPEPLISLWKKAYGEETARALLEHINDLPETTIRLNTLKMTAQEFENQLSEADIVYRREPQLPACYYLQNGSDGKRLAKIVKNCYYHQDAASQIDCLALGARPGERVADVCAAPGGKSFTIAQGMENSGELLSGDLYAAKCEAMEARAAELGITMMRTAVREASRPCPEPLLSVCDRVLWDVPCSGLGVIRRKPEIRYKPLADFADLPAIQYAILERAAAMCRPGGVLQYSTCTLNPAENEGVAARFLREHSDFQPRMLPLSHWFTQAGMELGASITLFPHIHNTDGFFVAGFVKMG